MLKFQTEMTLVSIRTVNLLYHAYSILARWLLSKSGCSECRLALGLFLEVVNDTDQYLAEETGEDKKDSAQSLPALFTIDAAIRVRISISIQARQLVFHSYHLVLA